MSSLPGTVPDITSLASAARGALVVNADDWGRDAATTDRILDCVRRGSVSSASAMVFMEDTERSVALAERHAVDTGLHLNLTAPFTATAGVPETLRRDHAAIASYLRGRRFHQALYNPRLASRFKAVVTAQLEEYARLYGAAPGHVDGHHHMHLCENVLAARLLPKGARVRRSFSFLPGEKSLLNRLYRRAIDARLARRHRITEYFFSLPPMEPGRIDRFCRLAHTAVVELETHPVAPEEFEFLMSGRLQQMAGDVPIQPRYAWPEASEVSVRRA
jgi:chitin disaccharide deacetylase